MPSSQQPTVQQLREIANRLREDVITMLLAAGSGHSAGPLGMADVFAALYFSVLKHDPRNPRWHERDYILLSNGHICPAWYAALAEAGYFPTSELTTLRKLGSRLQGHPHLGSLPGVENTSGPLALGLSQAAGIALGLKMDGKPNRVFCLLSDGEHQEGQTWEAYLFAGHRKLGNLTVLIDRNHIQIDGETEDVLDINPLKQKLESFRWHVLDIDGHDIAQIVDACQTAQREHHRPTAIICNTIPGKGVAFMEQQYQWHGQPPNRSQAQSALHYLRSLGGNIQWE